MRDKISLQISGKRIENFLSYRVNSNLFEVADSFSLSLANPHITIAEGARCKLYVNDRLELNGIADRISERYDKSTRSLTVDGRDLTGLLVDSYAEDFTGKKNESLKALTRRLLAPIPFINRSAIIFGKGSKDRAVPLTKTEDFEFTETSPAETVFEKLKQYALARGMLFFSLPNGTLVFGEPLTSGRAKFLLMCRKNGADNNIIEAERVRDISQRYSKVTVTGQRQGTDALTPEAINVSAGVVDRTFPFYKPFVAGTEHDGQSPKQYAGSLLERQQFEGFSLRYKTYGHSQNGKNFQVNSVCHVSDEIYGIEEDFLIYARTFEMSKQGVFTNLRLSRLGVLPS